MEAYSTKQVAKLLKITEGRMHDLLRRGKITPPPMIGRSLVWLREHVDAAREAVKKNPVSAPSRPASSTREAV